MQHRQVQFAQEWVDKQQPRLELRAGYLWRHNVAGHSKLEARLARLVDVRLPKAQQAIIDSGVSRKADISKLCEGLRPTTYEIAEVKWLLELIDGDMPLPLRQRQLSTKPAPGRAPQKRKSKRPSKRSAQRYRGSGHYSATLPGIPSRRGRPARPASATSIDDDNVSADSMDDFIDDDDDNDQNEVASEAPSAATSADATADATAGHFASMSLGSTARERSFVPACNMTAEEFAAELR
ncbi:hypothetical protein IWW38_000654 [Coemansia aciculifera]|uniref:Uncharacterized protein n=1 Tax=Coemansia aciculifera TaxID=417176 RepID=A0ACC1MAD9_9FUNG|nr:hypothetical protein IWW38_000654 [Coemansia aciculifera]